MSILLDQTTRVIVQGFTGKIGSFHAQEMIDYGTNVVGGVTPGKGGTTHLGLPVFNTVEAAVAATGADRQHRLRAAALRRGFDHGSGRRRDRALRRHHRRHPRPGHDPGEALHAPLQARAAHVPDRAQLRRRHQPGQGDAGHHAGAHLPAGRRSASSAAPARSATKPRAQMKALGIGISTSVGIGGDPINGSSFKDVLALFEADPETEAVMMIGEIGGPQEAEAAQFVRDHMTKPVVAYIAGLTAPKGRRMGHAGAIISAFGESADEKVEILQEAGVRVAPNPSELGTTVASLLARAA